MIEMTIALPWTIAPDVKRWEDIVADCQVVVLPEMLRAHFAVNDSGQVLVNSTPEMNDEDQAADLFLELWERLHAIQQCVQIAMGNALVFAQAKFGDDFIQHLMEFGQLSYHTYRQRMSVARNVPPENQDPTVSFSKLRAIAPAPPPVQRQLLNDIHAGKLTTSPQVAAERRRIMKEPPQETFAPTAKLPCPICGADHGWDIDRLQWSECDHCHGKALELRDHLDILRKAVKALLETGDIGPVQTYASQYRL